MPVADPFSWCSAQVGGGNAAEERRRDPGGALLLWNQPVRAAQPGAQESHEVICLNLRAQAPEQDRPSTRRRHGKACAVPAPAQAGEFRDAARAKVRCRGDHAAQDVLPRRAAVTAAISCRVASGADVQVERAGHRHRHLEKTCPWPDGRAGKCQRPKGNAKRRAVTVRARANADRHRHSWSAAEVADRSRPRETLAGRNSDVRREEARAVAER